MMLFDKRQRKSSAEVFYPLFALFLSCQSNYHTFYLHSYPIEGRKKKKTLDFIKERTERVLVVFFPLYYSHKLAIIITTTGLYSSDIHQCKFGRIDTGSGNHVFIKQTKKELEKTLNLGQMDINTNIDVMYTHTCLTCTLPTNTHVYHRWDIIEA